MDGSTLDEKIDKALDRLDKAKKMWEEGVIPEEDYKYEENKYNQLKEQRKILDNAKDDANKEIPSPFPLLKFIIIFLFLSAIFLGNFHLLIGSKINGLMISERASFGYSEIIIDTDKIISMNPWKAKEEYPLSYNICEKEGFY